MSSGLRLGVPSGDPTCAGGLAGRAGVEAPSMDAVGVPGNELALEVVLLAGDLRVYLRRLATSSREVPDCS